VELLRIYSPEDCGRDGYPLAWHKGQPAIKAFVREQADHRCVRCGHPYRCGAHGGGQWSPCDSLCRHDGPLRVFYGEDVEPVLIPELSAGFVAADTIPIYAPEGRVDAEWRVLTVHHLTGEKADCRWWNLAALCQRCHLQVQGRVRMEQVYPHEHSAWFRPYAAGYYAATYLGEDLTREQTLARLDELLALELEPQLTSQRAA
jgi:hypothetical protein